MSQLAIDIEKYMGILVTNLTIILWVYNNKVNSREVVIWPCSAGASKMSKGCPEPTQCKVQSYRRRFVWPSGSQGNYL